MRRAAALGPCTHWLPQRSKSSRRAADRAGIGDNWERCDYDWSQPSSVKATVKESNVYAVPGSSWEIKATPNESGSQVEMIWIRGFQRNARGRIFGTAFRLVGDRIFEKYGRDIVKNLEKIEAGVASDETAASG